MISATWSFFAMPGQDWCIAFRGKWPSVPYWCISREFRLHTYRAIA